MRGHQTAPEQRWHPSRPHLLSAERGNPVGVRRSAGRPDARRAELLSGKRRPKKRKSPAERQGESITRRIGPLPSRKAADVGLVSYPKGVVKAVNRGTSY